jgi:thiol-disulfide isomerase/thioredoxin
MKRTVLAVLLVFVAATTAPAQSKGLIPDVRAAIAANDFSRGEQLIAAYRSASGVTPEMLAALSWMARGTLAAKQLDKAETYAEQTYQQATGMLNTRKLDADANLQTAVGAAIEVLAQVGAARGERSAAVAFVQKELQTFKGSTIEKRIQKNLNLLTLEGTVAPAIDLSEYLGAKPPSLASYKGKVVLLFFWAHWCGDCKRQGPVLARLMEKYGSQGLSIFAPTQRFGYVAGGKDAPPDVEKAYIDEIRKTHYAMLEGQPVPLSTANHMRYGVSTTPTIVLVDRAGKVRLYHPGQMTEEELEPTLKQLLAQS